MGGQNILVTTNQMVFQATGNVLAMTGHGSPRMFKGFNDLRWCRNEIFIVSFLQSLWAFFRMSSLGPWETILSWFALEAERIVIFDYHFEGQNAPSDVWGVETVPEQHPKTCRWFGSIFKIPIKNRDSPFGVMQVMNTLTKNIYSFTLWMLPGV